MPRVLVVATSRKTRGGITSVVKAHETGEQWKKFHCLWIETHRDGNSIQKICYFISGLLHFLVLLPFVDIVHIHIAAVTRKMPFVFLAKFFRKKLIVHMHFPGIETTLEDKRLSPRYGWCIRKADICIALSYTWKKLIEEYYHVSNVRVLYNPCPSVNRAPYSDREKYILFAGTVSQRKGNQDLVAAFARIASKYPDWKIRIAGNGDIEGGIKQAKELGVSNQIEYLGWISGTAKDVLFRRAAVYCLPSYAEGFPMSVLDAWAYGTPVITTPVGGIPDVAKDGINMMLFEPGDISTLSEKIDELLSDSALREKMAKGSCVFADYTFNINSITQQLGELYKNLSHANE